MKNGKIRAYAKQNGVRLWEVADGFGITDNELSRRLRHEFSDADRAKAFALIDEIAKAHEEGAEEE